MGSERRLLSTGRRHANTAERRRLEDNGSEDQWERTPLGHLPRGYPTIIALFPSHCKEVSRKRNTSSSNFHTRNDPIDTKNRGVKETTTPYYSICYYIVGEVEGDELWFYFAQRHFSWVRFSRTRRGAVGCCGNRIGFQISKAIVICEG